MIAIPKKRRRHNQVGSEPAYMPTLAQIARRAETIRDGWTQEEEVQRLTGTDYRFLNPRIEAGRIPSVREDFDTCDNEWWVDQIGARG